MDRARPEREKKFLEELKKRSGGIDFKKNPLTKREMYEAIKRVGCVSLEEIAYERRRGKVRRK